MFPVLSTYEHFLRKVIKIPLPSFCHKFKDQEFKLRNAKSISTFTTLLHEDLLMINNYVLQPFLLTLIQEEHFFVFGESIVSWKLTKESCGEDK